MGFFGEDDALLLTIVRANEYGADIKPKKGDYLYVPYKKANGKQGLYKLKEVHIPARPFIKNAWKANEEKYARSQNVLRLRPSIPCIPKRAGY